MDSLDVGWSRDPARRNNWYVNCISVVPKSIGHMEKLKHLNLSGNDIRELPTEFGQLVSLTVLTMGKYIVSELMETIQCRWKLHEIDVDS